MRSCKEIEREDNKEEYTFLDFVSGAAGLIGFIVLICYIVN